MPFYLSLDGGGTKCCAIFYNEDGPLGYGCSGGTNTNFTTIEDCRGNIARCLDQALAGYPNPRIEVVYAVLVGPNEALTEALNDRANVGELVCLGEGKAALLAGALRESGIVALSGTGSDAFYVSGEGERQMVGGMGSILGDQGSGVWIGQRALRAALSYWEGWGTETLMLPLLCDKWGVADKWQVVQAVYGAPAPFRKVASFVPIAAEAARLGDRVAIGLFEEAGRVMAEQTLALIRRADIANGDRVCVCCGGAWKAHPAMHLAFKERMAEAAQDIRVQKPMFENVMAGVVANEYRRFPALDTGQLKTALPAPYQRFRAHWQEG